jgi:hypothetical protein
VKSFITRKLIAGATGLVLLGGAAGAVAATQLSGGSGRQAFINDLASHLSVTPSALTAAMKATEVDRIQAAVAAGRITQAQANTIEQRIQQGDGLPFFGHRFGGHMHGGLRAAAQYLGITETTLRADLQSGKSLATIALTTPGKSSAGLKDAILAAAKSRLDAERAGGTITATQEQQQLSNISQRIDPLINRTWPTGTGFGTGFRSRAY